MSTHISVPPQLLLERILTLEIVRVTERAAVSAARLRGHGNEKAADQAAVDAMRRELNKLPIEGTVVIGGMPSPSMVTALVTPITCAIEDDLGTMVGCTRCSMPFAVRTATPSSFTR